MGSLTCWNLQSLCHHCWWPTGLYISWSWWSFGCEERKEICELEPVFYLGWNGISSQYGKYVNMQFTRIYNTYIYIYIPYWIFSVTTSISRDISSGFTNPDFLQDLLSMCANLISSTTIVPYLTWAMKETCLGWFRYQLVLGGNLEISTLKSRRMIGHN